jgi:itaconate CoA-transferase
LRRIEVDTPNGFLSYPAPAAIVVEQPRRYGAVPGIGTAGSTKAKRS